MAEEEQQQHTFDLRRLGAPVMNVPLVEENRWVIELELDVQVGGSIGLKTTTSSEPKKWVQVLEQGRGTKG
jgi:hypothetical protein